MKAIQPLVFVVVVMMGVFACVSAQAHVMPPLPPPVVRVPDLRADEKPVEVASEQTVTEENALFRRVRTSFVFTNPNARVMAGEFEFPIPEEATVCGYALEVSGSMVPGVVCEKEKARVAFENEVRKGVDPGLVEHVKGNIWRTRLFPLNPKTPRRAEVEFVEPKSTDNAPHVALERDGEDLFVATVRASEAKTTRDAIVSFTAGTILWDASLSAKPFAAAWRAKLEALPEGGEWALVIFRQDCEIYAKTFGFSKASLLKKLDEVVYDGGTDIGAALEGLGGADLPLPALLFTDEIDTLGLVAPQYEEITGLTVASRPDAPKRVVEIRKLAKGETVPGGVEPKAGRLLATVWAARRMADLASQAEARREEFMALGRRYGVAGPGLSLIVLETLEQYLEHKVEPPAELGFHDAWVRHRAADDDPIADKKAKAEHEQRLLQYWEERVKWWNDPKPPRQTPKSGLFDGVGRVRGVNGASNARVESDEDVEFDKDVVLDEEAGVEDRGVVPQLQASALVMRNAVVAGVRSRWAEEPAVPAAAAKGAAPAAQGGEAGSGTAPTVTLKAWDPKTPYLDALKAAAREEAYGVYLKEREHYVASPAFYLDCAGWFFKAGRKDLAVRILSNLAEFKLEDAALWRSMGWRAREAGSYGLAIRAFRKVLALRGEEAQSRRDLALVLMESGKSAIADGDWERLKRDILSRYNFQPENEPDFHLKRHLAVARAQLEEAMELFAAAAFVPCARRSGRRGNDFQVSVLALEELNGLIAWVEALAWPDGKKAAVPAFDAAYRRDLPVKLRIVMSWDADETDIDLHVLEPNGEEAYYGHRRTAEGGFVSEDVTTGYGPEEYLKKELEHGIYKVLSNYYASHQTALTGATTVTATVYTDWGTAQEKRQVLTLRLDKPKSKHLIGEVEL